MRIFSRLFFFTLIWVEILLINDKNNIYKIEFKTSIQNAEAGKEGVLDLDKKSFLTNWH